MLDCATTVIRTERWADLIQSNIKGSPWQTPALPCSTIFTFFEPSHCGVIFDMFRRFDVFLALG